MTVDDVVRRLRIREQEAQAQGLLQLAIDLKLAILELERLERYRIRVSRGPEGLYPQSVRRRCSPR
jgi:hypothetical protein